MDPPKHDRMKALFQQGFTPRRIAEHEDAIRAIAIDVLDQLQGKETFDLVAVVAQPAARVIGSFMGLRPRTNGRLGRRDEHGRQAGDRDEMMPRGSRPRWQLRRPRDL